MDRNVYSFEFSFADILVKISMRERKLKSWKTEANRGFKMWIQDHSTLSPVEKPVNVLKLKPEDNWKK